MPTQKLLLIHQFPLRSVTGVTVMLGEMLRLIPQLEPGIEVEYLHYEGCPDGAALEGRLEAGTAPACAIGVNLHIEAGWECSLALARWCAQRAVPLYNYVQDYWPHHFEPLRELTACGVELVGSSPFINASLAADQFRSGYLPMGAQLPPPGPARPGSRTIASIGRLVRRKRFPDVVRAFCGAGLDRTARLQLTVLGSQVFGSEQDALQLRLITEQIGRPGVRAEAIQLLTTPTVPPDYAGFAAYVLASDYEGFSMTPYEAAYAGCPPIVSDIPPHRFMAQALFGEHAGEFLYPVGDTLALGASLADELATGSRRRRLEADQEGIRRTIETGYSVRTTARAMVALFKACAP